MAPALRLRAIDDADEALQPRLLQHPAEPLLRAAQVEQEFLDLAVVRDAFVAAGQRRPHRLHLPRRVPFGRGADGARLRAEPDHHRFPAEPLTASPAAIQLLSPSPPPATVAIPPL